MGIKQVTLKHFRCFTAFSIRFDHERSIIEGPNGVGKTSLLEALYFGCYLKSFRSSRIKDLVSLLTHEEDAFFIEIEGSDGDETPFTISIGYSKGQKKVKVNQKVVTTFKDIIDYYRVVSLTEDDLAIVQAGPEVRRSLIDSFIMLHDPSYLDDMRRLKKVLEQRNSMFQQAAFTPQIKREESEKLWTQQLWQASRIIVQTREKYLALLSEKISELLVPFSSSPDSKRSCHITYNPKASYHDSFDAFWHALQVKLLPLERKYKRTLFGAHLDDMVFMLDGKDARKYASRGQQKLLVVLSKLAQAIIIHESFPSSSLVLLLDDFITDFDETILQKALLLLGQLHNCHIITTTPIANVISFKKEDHILLKYRDSF